MEQKGSDKLPLKARQVGLLWIMHGNTIFFFFTFFFNRSYINLASYADILLAPRNLPHPRTAAEAKGTFLKFLFARLLSSKDRLEIT